MKPIGNIKNIKVDITKPIAMDVDMTMNQIAIMVGPNGSGKTMMLKLIWIMSNITNSYGAMANMQHYDAEKSAKQLFDGTFDDQDFTGTIEVNFEYANAYIKLDDGEVDGCISVTMDSDVSSFGMPIFMSKTMRTFDEISQYLKFRQMIGIHGELGVKDAQRMEKLEAMYKIYDIMYVEKMISAFGNGKAVPPQTLTALHNFTGMEKYDIMAVRYDDNAREILWEDKAGNENKFTRMSAGEQALCNMVLAQTMLN